MRAKNKLKMGLAGLVLASGIASGCETPEAALATSLLGVAGMVSPNATPESAAWGQLFSTGGQMEYQRLTAKEAAEAGKTEVNVNVGGGQNRATYVPTYEVINLDTNEQVIIRGNKNYDNYVYKRKKDQYPKKGFKIIYEPDEEGKREWIILNMIKEWQWKVMERGVIYPK